MRTGIILPTFRPTPDEAFDVARRAVAAGIDGLFCYDHIWPMGQPDRPALAPFPLLAALVATLDDGDVGHRSGPFVGPLVARVGLVPNQVLVNQFLALDHLAPGRVIAGLGTGDRLSEEENVAYGVPFASAAERRAELVEVARALKASGLEVSDRIRLHVVGLDVISEFFDFIAREVLANEITSGPGPGEGTVLELESDGEAIDARAWLTKAASPV